jgi:hypothetical protein
MNPRFRITVGSEPDYENLVGDLYFDDAIVCVVTQEGGIEAAQLKLFGPPHGDNWEFQLRDFEEALAALRNRLWELR